MVENICSPNILDADAGGSQVRLQFCLRIYIYTYHDKEMNTTACSELMGTAVLYIC